MFTKTMRPCASGDGTHSTLGLVPKFVTLHMGGVGHVGLYSIRCRHV
jgi:hypothetical protein